MDKSPEYLLCSAFGGSGTESSPYQITTKPQLNAVRNATDKCYKLMNDLTFTDADYTLGGSFAGGWTPIPSFSGTFDGNAHAIYGLEGEHGGMFKTNSGTITSLRLVDHRLCGTSTFGAIANNNNGTIIRCYTKSAFTATDLPARRDPVDWRPYTGGVAGYNSGTVSYCRNDGLVCGFGSIRYGNTYVGGIVGYNNGTVTSCATTGQIYVRSYAHGEYGYFGGVVGVGTASYSRSGVDIHTDNTYDYETNFGGITNTWPSSTSYVIGCIADPYAATSANSYYNYKAAIGGYSSATCDSYCLSERYVPNAYPDLDFDSVWMFTAEGPMPQGVMDADGHLLSVWLGEGDGT